MRITMGLEILYDKEASGLGWPAGLKVREKAQPFALPQVVTWLASIASEDEDVESNLQNRL